jgi:hypothetical protein
MLWQYTTRVASFPLASTSSSAPVPAPAAPYQRDLLVLDVLIRRPASARPSPIALRAISLDLGPLALLLSVLGQFARALVAKCIVMCSLHGVVASLASEDAREGNEQSVTDRH